MKTKCKYCGFETPSTHRDICGVCSILKQELIMAKSPQLKPNNSNDWSSRFDKKFTRKCLGGKEKGQYMDKWFVRETTAKELKVFISSELQYVFEEIEREIDSIDHTRDGVCNHGYCDICGNDLISRGHNSAIVSMRKILDSLRQKYCNSELKVKENL